jgi:hypothetical protein
LAILAGSGTGQAVTSPLSSIDPPFSNANYSNGSIKTPGDFVDNSTKTRYNVVVDISKARNYTYNLIPNPN